MNYLRFGPVAIKLSNRYQAEWAYERLRIGGLSFLSRDSGGGLTLAAYHPRSCPTWHWSVSVQRYRGGETRRLVSRTPKQQRRGQWHDRIRLPFGRYLCISRQDYHKQRP